MTTATDPRVIRKVVTSALIGATIEWYDFFLYGVVAGIVFSKLYFPSDDPLISTLLAYTTFAVGFVTRPLGGVIFGHFGDRVGRKSILVVTLMIMGVSTFLIGLLPTHAQIGALAPLLLLAMRIVQGIAVGGEVPGAWVFVAEHVPRSRVGIACATLTAGLTAGILIGSLLAAWINTRYSTSEVQAWVWRVPFLIGGVFGFVAVRLRRWLEETPVFVEMRERRQLARQVPVKQVLAAHRPAVVLSILASWQLTAAIVVIVLLTPTLVQTSFGIAPAVAFHGNSLATLALVFGCLAAGWAVDRIGVGRALLSGSLGLGVAAYALYGALLAGHEAQFVAWYTLAGFCCGVVGVTPALMVAAFPPEVRFSGLSFSYNVAYAVFGGLTPPLLAWLAEAWGPLAPAHYVAFTCVVGAGVALWCLRRPLSTPL